MELCSQMLTHDYLNNLKFRDLHKLAVQHKVNKRWAKKQDMINSLLALSKENIEWKDASDVIESSTKNNTGTEGELRRLTFNIDKASILQNAKATFEVAQPKGSLLPLKNDDFDRRLTFDVPTSFLPTPPTQPNIGPFIKGETKLNVQKLSDNDLQQSKLDKLSSRIHKLSIPSPRVLRRTKHAYNDEVLKMSQKSINIKKTSRVAPGKSIAVKQVPANIATRRVSLDLDPKESQPKKSSHINADFNTRKSLGNQKNTNTNRLRAGEETERRLSQSGKSVGKKLSLDLEEKENVPKETTPANSGIEMNTLNNKDIKSLREQKLPTTGRRKSKTEDNTTSNKGKTIKVNFLTPPASMKNKVQKPTLPVRGTPAFKLSTVNKLEKAVSKIPKAKPVSVLKPLTATKMPDFASIHKKQFEKMDSLDEYLNKKAERARKLFATPVLKTNKPETVQKSSGKKVQLFQFKSNKMEKDVSHVSKLPLRQAENKTTLKAEAVKLTTQKREISSIKEKNRKVLNGVRTNKRFELQMKFRNIS